MTPKPKDKPAGKVKLTKAQRKKPKFKVGEYVNLLVKVLRIDRRRKHKQYTVQGLVAGWVLEDPVEENELYPLTFHKHHKRERGQ